MSTDVQEQMHVYRKMQRLGALQPCDGPMVLVGEIDRLTAELAAMREASKEGESDG